MGERREARLRHLELAAEQALVERFHVLHHGLDLDTTRVDETMQQRVKDERVVRAGRESEAQPHGSRLAALRIAVSRSNRSPSRGPHRFEMPRSSAKGMAKSEAA